jgi:hypothetical protein
MRSMRFQLGCQLVSTCTALPGAEPKPGRPRPGGGAVPAGGVVPPRPGVLLPRCSHASKPNMLRAAATAVGFPVMPPPPPPLPPSPSGASGASDAMPRCGGAS